jgi:hypothetical protein
MKARGLRIDCDLTHALRFHPSLFYDGRTRSGVVALMRDVLSDEPRAVHRTFLSEEGHKLDRRMLGPARGTAIKLDADDEVSSGLHIGEGLETCLAARQLGYRPVWALGSAGAIATFPVLPGIESLTILGENDNASTRAAETCGRRYEEAGREVWIVEPPTGDMNDIVRRVA